MISCSTKKLALITIISLAPALTFSMPAIAAAPDSDISPLPLPLKLPKSLESRRAEFDEDVAAAQKNIAKFASDSGWKDLLKTPLVKSVEIFESKEAYDDYVRSKSPDMKGKPLPKTFSAAADWGDLIAVTPEIFEANSPNDREPQAYVKLLTHELAHRLEVRAVNGDEDKMGPIWFFEGFAVHAADQYQDKLPTLSDDEIWRTVGAKERGSYAKYRVVFEHFLKGVSIQEYVKHAGGSDFVEWLHHKNR